MVWLKRAAGFLAAALTPLLIAGGSASEPSELRPSAEKEDASQTNPRPGLEALEGSRLFADVERYVSLGLKKRTGSSASRRINGWLARSLRQAGYRLTFQEFGLDRYQLYGCALWVEGLRRECFPLWYPNDSTLIDEPVRVLEVRGYSQGSLDSDGVLSEEIASGPSGMILVNNLLPEVMGINASLESAETPFPMPIVVVGDEDRDLLAGGSSNTITVDKLYVFGSSRPNSVGHNVIGYLPSRSPTDKTVVISTPTTGWFAAGGERGPGVALWRGLARWASSSDLPVHLVFLGTAGHELDFMGMREFISSAPDPEDVLFWVHLGASIVTQTEGDDGAVALRYSRLDYNDEALSPALNRHLGPVGFEPALQSERTAGTLAFIMNRGYRSFGFYGAFRKFHTRDDFADSTSGEALEPVARALALSIAELVQSLTSAPRP